VVNQLLELSTSGAHRNLLLYFLLVHGDWDLEESAQQTLESWLKNCSDPDFDIAR